MKPENIQIQWLGHACYRITAGGYSLVLDPYEDGYVPGLPPLRIRANAVLCSHLHGDHGARKVVPLDMPEAPSPFSVSQVQSWHDDQQGALRGPNIIHVLEAGGLRVAHLGDLGHRLSPEQVRAIGRLDAVMIPIGGHYTIDAATAKAVTGQLQPRVILPMHYRGDGFGFDVLGTLDAFTQQFDTVRHMDSDAITITAGMAEQVAVLALPLQRA